MKHFFSGIACPVMVGVFMITASSAHAWTSDFTDFSEGEPEGDASLSVSTNSEDDKLRLIFSCAEGAINLEISATAGAVLDNSGRAAVGDVELTGGDFLSPNAFIAEDNKQIHLAALAFISARDTVTVSYKPPLGDEISWKVSAIGATKALEPLLNHQLCGVEYL